MFRSLSSRVMGKNSNPHEKMTRICNETGKLDKLESLVAITADGFFRDARYDGFTPLHLTIKNNFLDCAKFLIVNVGIDINAKADGTDDTALHMASAAGNLAAVQLLFEFGKPNINALNNEGCSALFLSCKFGHMDICATLDSRGAGLGFRDHADMSCLHVAAAGGHLPVVSFLIERRAVPVDQLDGITNCTALHFASMYGRKAVVQYLLDVAHADVDKKDSTGLTCLDKIGVGGSASSAAAAGGPALAEIKTMLQRAAQLKADSVAAAEKAIASQKLMEEKQRQEEMQRREEELASSKLAAAAELQRQADERKRVEEEEEERLSMEAKQRAIEEEELQRLAEKQVEEESRRQQEDVVAYAALDGDQPSDSTALDPEPVSKIEVVVESEVSLTVDEISTPTAIPTGPAAITESVAGGDVSDPIAVSESREEQLVDATTAADATTAVDEMSVPGDNAHLESTETLELEISSLDVESPATAPDVTPPDAVMEPMVASPAIDSTSKEAKTVQFIDIAPTTVLVAPAASSAESQPAVVSAEDSFSARARKWQEARASSSRNLVLDAGETVRAVPIGASVVSTPSPSSQSDNVSPTVAQTDVAVAVAVAVAVSVAPSETSPVEDKVLSTTNAGNLQANVTVEEEAKLVAMPISVEVSSPRRVSPVSSAPLPSPRFELTADQSLEEKIKRIMSTSLLSPTPVRTRPTAAVPTHDDNFDSIVQPLISGQDYDSDEDRRLSPVGSDDVSAVLATATAPAAVTVAGVPSVAAAAITSPEVDSSGSGQTNVNANDVVASRAEAKQDAVAATPLRIKPSVTIVTPRTGHTLDDFNADSPAPPTAAAPTATSSTKKKLHHILSREELLPRKTRSADESFLDDFAEDDSPVRGGFDRAALSIATEHSDGEEDREMDFSSKIPRVNVASTKGATKSTPSFSELESSQTVKTPKASSQEKVEPVKTPRSSKVPAPSPRNQPKISFGRTNTVAAPISPRAGKRFDAVETVPDAHPISQSQSHSHSHSHPQPNTKSDWATPTSKTRSPLRASESSSTPVQSPLNKRQVSGAVKLLSALAKLHGKTSFKQLCRAFFRWGELMTDKAKLVTDQSDGDSCLEGGAGLLSPVAAEGTGDVDDLPDNSFTYAGNYGNGQFASSLTSLCKFYERYHYSDRRIAKAKAFLALKYHRPNLRDLQAVPPTVKKVFKHNEFVLWPMFVHYVHNDLAVPKAVKGSNHHRKKKLLGHVQIWSLFRDLNLSPDLIGKLQLESLVNEICGIEEQRSPTKTAESSSPGPVTPNKGPVSLRGLSVESPRLSRTSSANTMSSRGMSPTGRSSGVRTPTSRSPRHSTPTRARDDDCSSNAGGSSIRAFNRMESLRASLLSSQDHHTVAGHDAHFGATGGITIEKISSTGPQILSFENFVKLLWRLVIDFVDMPGLGATSRLLVLLRRIDTSDVRKHIMAKSVRASSIQVHSFSLGQFSAAVRAREVLGSLEEEEEAYHQGFSSSNRSYAYEDEDEDY